MIQESGVCHATLLVLVKKKKKRMFVENFTVLKTDIILMKQCLYTVNNQ